MYHELKKRKAFLLKEIENLKKQMSEFPEGKLICIKNGKYFGYRVYCKGGNSYHIRKNDDKLINTLATKKYFQALLDDLENELDTVNFCLEKYSSISSKADCLVKDPKYGNVILKNIKTPSQELDEWSKAEYRQSNIHAEALQFKSSSGHMVRSKSELLIANALFAHRIPFRYECELVLNEIPMYPDFTIRHPITGEYKYWEHFGLIDSPTYVNNLSQKLGIYCQNNIIPSVNLIMTFENRKYPLTPSVIEDTIQRNFL